jgi:hypothetical protein
MKHHHHCRTWRDENPHDTRSAVREWCSIVAANLAVAMLVGIIVSKLCR